MVDAVTGIGRKAHGKALGLQVCGASPQGTPYFYRRLRYVSKRNRSTFPLPGRV